MDIGSIAMNLVPKSIRQALRQSLRIVLREELEKILHDKLNSNPRVVARELGVLLGQQLSSYYPAPDQAGEIPVIPNQDVYAFPRTITNLDECYFYHTMDIPGYGHVKGEWDLRGHENEYLGGMNFDGKRVLELGTANGFFCFYMESQGAEVVAYDLSKKYVWDIIPYSRFNYEHLIADFRVRLDQINNGYWLCHQAHNSNAKVVYGTVYDIPEGIGLVDVSTFSSILLHLRDPFLALQNALKLTTETVVIVEPLPDNLEGPTLRFLPNPKTCEPQTTWWHVPPEVIKRFIGVLGFEETEIKYHTQTFNVVPAEVPYYTLIGRRTVSMR
jgi:hypothetical protein